MSTKKELEITNEDIELLKEMKKNCLKSNVYEDDKRLLKSNAVTKFLMLYEENEKLKARLELFENGVYFSRKNDRLEEENDKLKKQLEEKNILIKQCELSVSNVMDCYCERTDCSGRIKDSKKYDSLVQKVENQQKEFINYLERKLFILHDEMTELTIEMCNTDYQNTKLKIYQEILQKYKKIIGVKDEKDNN